MRHQAPRLNSESDQDHTRFITKELTMKIKSLLLFASLLLPMTPALVSAEGAPAMPLVVCQVDKAPQMLVPAYVCQWYGGSQHY
ncbi:hypothetical protein E4630_01095 [Aeromonas hydrophila]|nr:hypothetical protein E4625_01095 [Aeromonas hydrophila]QBX74322.1 hypothetical protein E4630_01095 [Aeromonas hydrophila]